MMKAKGASKGKTHAAPDNEAGQEEEKHAAKHEAHGSHEAEDESEEHDSKDKNSKKKVGLGKKVAHATEEVYEHGVKQPVEAESELEDKNPDFKLAAAQWSNVLDPAKTTVAVIDAFKSHMKDLKAAKRAQEEAEKALATFLGEHGGKSVPNQHAAPPTT